MLIIIPAYNEEGTISKIVASCLQYGPAVVIDDGSADRTAAAAQSAGAHVIRHGENRGYAAALRTGYSYALGRGHNCIVQLDADGQHDPRHILRMIKTVLSGGYDVAIGSRYFHGYPVEFSKAVGVMFFRLVVWIATGMKLTDPTSGYQCLNRKAMEHCLNNPTEYPDANAIIGLHGAGLRITEIPVRMQPNPEGRSMHRGARKIVRYMCLVMWDIFRTILQKG
jgi:glycosyltransferase involved in cell wall biosynthesis